MPIQTIIFFFLVFVKIKGLCSEKLQKLQFLKSDWDLIEREEVAIASSPQADLLCAIKCSVREECAGSLYDKTKGKSWLKIFPYLSILNICRFMWIGKGN